MVSQTGQRIHDSRHGPPFVVTRQRLHIFKEKRGWFFCLQNSGNLKKKGSPGVLKTVAFADDAKGLARKASQKDVVVRDMAGWNFSDIPMGKLPEIFVVNRLAFFIHFAGKDAFNRNGAHFCGVLDGVSKTADASEKVNEPRCFFVAHAL